jgi:uncharacterized protein (DUF1015 family)
MADFQPFHALRYNPVVAGDPSLLVAPPYDVVSPAQLAALHARSEFNISRIDNGEQRPADGDADNRYSRAAADVHNWILKGALVREADARLYVYDQEFELHGERRRRRAIFGRLRAEEWEKGIVLPHEYTGAEAKQDRLNLLRATRVHLSPIMAMYETPPSALFAEADIGAPVLDAVLDGERHTLRPLNGAAAERITGFLADKRLYIADGHHRYETGVNYRNEVRDRAQTWTGDEPENFVLAALLDVAEPDLVVLPTHRLLRTPASEFALDNLARLFAIEDSGASETKAVEALVAALAEAGGSGPAFGVIGLTPGRLHLLRPLPGGRVAEAAPAGHAAVWRALDVNALEHAIYPAIGYQLDAATIDYTEDAAQAAKAVLSGDFKLALLLNATPIAQIVACSNAGERMPRKSTFFYPKLGTGIVMYPLD